MKISSGILFPAAVVSFTVAAALGLGSPEVRQYSVPKPLFVTDTVVYVQDAYKLKRVGNLEDIRIADSLLADVPDTTAAEEPLDTLPKLTARDTIHPPEWLRLTDPWRYKYYVALIDSLTHVIVRDSLRHSSDSLKIQADTLLARIPPDSLGAFALREHARLDSLDWRKIDSVYVADSTHVADSIFLAWYNSLSRKERRAYDEKMALPAKLARLDSIQKAKEARQALRDSLEEFTPRILLTYAIPDSMQYKRIIEWTVDQDNHNLNAHEPDTTYNYHFNDYPIFRNDVNATWLGVAGSPAQYYNFFNRTSDERVPFYDAQEMWSFSPRTLPHYNTKTPHTELAYYGTILAGDEKESDNLHIFTTQNITPELNFALTYDRFGGGGILESETTTNKTFAARVNYLGRKYLAHFGYIYNMVDRKENGGITDRAWIRDTTVEPREIPVNLSGASSKIVKHTWFLEQQYRVPFEFIKDLLNRQQADTTVLAQADSLTMDAEGLEDYPEDPDSEDAPAAEEEASEPLDTLDRNVTTFFIGHSSEWSRYARNYTDNITNLKGAEYYHDLFNYGNASSDSLGTMKLDNKLFLRLQPWGSESIVSRIDVGVGDELRHYFDSTSLRPTTHAENSFYLYTGAQGQIRNYFYWDAKAKVNLLGYKIGDTEIEGGASFNFYPFRRARKSPVTVSGRFGSTLLTPDYYTRVLNTNHYMWQNDFGKISTTTIRGRIDVPRWKLSADVGYALLANNIWYDTLGFVQQNATPMSIISASVRKEFVAGPMHFDNRVLFQYSSQPDIVPLPLVALNLRWYVQIPVQPGVMTMQVGANAFYNTQWYAPAWNPALGVFQAQNQNLYENGPFFDLFLNIQWKRLCLFIKYQNVGRGWPMERKDYFTADRYIYTIDGMEGLKLGMFWPFYFSTDRHVMGHSSGGGGGGSSMSGGGRSGGGGGSSRSSRRN
ncbi:MAG: putative porin [Bacteroidales bacterium]|nr:putative porin [Bacteroidales bacterium]